MDIHSWKETWGTIDWTLDSEKEIKAKIKKFYNAGVDFNMRDDDNDSGCTPLFWAVNNSTPDIVAYMIDGGANPEERDNDNRTILHAAVSSEKVDNIKYLLKYGPKKLEEKKDFRGYTPLHLAVGLLMKKTEIIKILLEHNPDLINEKDNYGSTALSTAISWNKVNSTRILIERGADVTGVRLSESTSPKIKEFVENAQEIRENYLKAESQRAQRIAAAEAKEEIVQSVPPKAKETQVVSIQPEAIQPVATQQKKKPSLLSRLFNRQRG